MTFVPKHPVGGELHCIADQVIFKGNRFETVERILSWLIGRGIIKPEACPIRYQPNGHRFSEGIKQVITGPLPDLASPYFGLEYNTERKFYCFHPTLDYILCPHCKSDLEGCEEHEDVFWVALRQWEDHDGVEFLPCPACKEKVRFDEFKFGIICAFSDLAFTFFGCQGLTKEFQAEFEQLLGCQIHLMENYYV